MHLGLSEVQHSKYFAGEYNIPLFEANPAMRVKERSQALKNALFKNWPTAAKPGFYSYGARLRGTVFSAE